MFRCMSHLNYFNYFSPFSPFRLYCYFKKSKVLKYACLACMFKNLDQSVSNLITAASTFLTWTLLSILGQMSRQLVERPFGHLCTMKYWQVSGLLLFCNHFVSDPIGSKLSAYM